MLHLLSMGLQMKTTVRHSFVVVIIALLVGYYLNSQYSADQRFTLFFLNKTVAGVAIILISLSYILGPLCIVIPPLARYLSYRRYFGVAGFLAVLTHIILSILQWNGRFAFGWYVDHKYGITAAIIAAIIFTGLALVSHNRLVKDLGSKQWKFIQRLGYIALILSVFHIYIAAGNRWNQWLLGKVDMPNSVIVASIGTFVIILRLLALFYDKVFKKR